MDTIYLGHFGGTWNRNSKLFCKPQENIWIEDGYNIKREESEVNTFADTMKKTGSCKKWSKFSEYNHRNVMDILYGGLSDDVIKYLPSRYGNLSWIRVFILENDIKTVDEYKQKITEFAKKLAECWNNAYVEEKMRHNSSLDNFFADRKNIRFVNRSGRKKAFDDVVVEMRFIRGSKTKDEVMEFIKQNKFDIKTIAVESIANSKRYASYGVPTNFLKYEKMMLRTDDVLEVIFGLKIKAE